MIYPVLPLILILLSAFSLALKPVNGQTKSYESISYPDSIEYQILYNGSIWRNAYAAIEGNQFMYTSDFTEGTIEIEKHIFNNIKVRYDIQDDELQTLKSDGNIIQLNKDKISYFSLNYNGNILNFINMDMDTLSLMKGFWNLLSDSKIKLYVKYKKEILPTSYTNGLPRFNQVNSICVIKDNKIYRANKRQDLVGLFAKEDRVKINRFIRNSEIVVTRTDPDSFRQVIDYIGTITK